MIKSLINLTMKSMKNMKGRQRSGEYTVTYTKTLADMSTEECSYPLFVGAPGLRVGSITSTAPAASISSRTIAIALRRLRNPNGK